MESYLDRIIESTRARLDESKRRVSQPALEAEAAAQSPPRDFIGAICEPGISLVAEIKRRSASAGEISAGADPALLAPAYEKGGARALSVLTEPEFFGGSLEDLRTARSASALPVLRKDFVVDEYQVFEARAAGADAVLLIVAAIDGPVALKELISAAAGLGMAALVEAHDRPELESALAASATLVGINQRDLTTFEVDRGLAARLRPTVPKDIPVIAESGIAARAEVEALEAAGLDGVLVGETLMRAPDPAAATSALIGRGARDG